jgi:hypothetical protein
VTTAKARTLLIPLALLAAGAGPIPGVAREGAPAPEGSPAHEAAPAPAAPRGPRVYKLTVRPQPTTQPALRHRLLPDVADETPGNAAPLYLLAFIQAADVPQRVRELAPLGPEEAARYGIPPEKFHPGFDRILLYLEAPLDRLPREEVEQLLANYEPALRNLDLAARREHCRWELPVREHRMGAPLSHLNPARDLVNVAAVRARLQIARRDYAGAVATLQSTLELARDLNDQALLVQALVGAGIAGRSLQGVTELMQQPDGPNLYWSLAALPRPYMDLRAALRLERAFVLFAFPQLRRIHDDLSAEQWRAMFTHVSQVTGARGSGTSGEVSAAMHGVLLYPRAKQWLVEQGTPPQEVEAMSVASALARYQFGQYEVWYDEVLKLTALPYWQAQEGLRRVERRLADARDGNPLVAIIPAVHRAYLTGVMLDRQVAALQTVEALRNYAAAHDGQLPAQLEELSETPAAPDPTTGKPFVYRVQENHVTLESPAPPGERPTDAMRMEVTFVK